MRVIVFALAAVAFAAGLIIEPAALVQIARICLGGHCGVRPLWIELAGGAVVALTIAAFVFGGRKPAPPAPPADPPKRKPRARPSLPKPSLPKPGVPKPGIPKPGVPKPGRPKPGTPKPGTSLAKNVSPKSRRPEKP